MSELNRDTAYSFLHKHVTNEYQLHHAEMVETALRTVAKFLGEDENKWGILGLIHDWDFDQWPETHPGKFDQLQEELPGVDDEMIGALKGHADLSYHRETK